MDESVITRANFKGSRKIGALSERGGVPGKSRAAASAGNHRGLSETQRAEENPVNPTGSRVSGLCCLICLFFKASIFFFMVYLLEKRFLNCLRTVKIFGTYISFFCSCSLSFCFVFCLLLWNSSVLLSDQCLMITLIIMKEWREVIFILLDGGTRSLLQSFCGWFPDLGMH